MNESFNNEYVINSYKVLFDQKYDEIPQGDTINNYFRDVSVDQFKNIPYGMTRDFINKKV